MFSFSIVCKYFTFVNTQFSFRAAYVFPILQLQLQLQLQ